MQLAAIRIDNFRAIRAASLHFDDTTVLIGENNAGRSSVLEALALVLQPPHGDAELEFKPLHFHRTSARRGGGPLRIDLLFRERRCGEWGELEPVFPKRLLKKRGRGPRERSLEVCARSGGPRRATAVEWSVRAPGSPKFRNDREVLAALRRQSPLGMGALVFELVGKFGVGQVDSVGQDERWHRGFQVLASECTESNWFGADPFQWICFPCGNVLRS